MNKILKVRNVGDYSRWVGHTDRHPLVSVIDYAEVSPIRHSLNNYSIYGIFFHDEAEIDLAYGCGKYDYKKGTVICVAPGQIGGKEDNGERVMLTGWALLFHPDLIRGTSLGRNIGRYTFFSYEVREALHLSEQERRTILDCLHNIRHELQHAIDRHSRTLVVNNIEMFLNYCVRFYDRQFITRSDVAGKDILARFERTLDDYFLSDKPQTEGLPTVQYCAQELHLSANYFGDLVKRLTGKTAQEHIRLRLIDAAKERIADPARSIAEVAYELGFKYPAHFTRLFKNVVGCTPNRYRSRFD